MTDEILDAEEPARRRIAAPFETFDRARPSVAAAGRKQSGPYEIGLTKTLAHSALRFAPPVWREKLAERFLRRAGAPGPAAEHVVQYLLSATRAASAAERRKGAVVAKGADQFYARQYRQHLNPTMGAFAMTATMALLGAGRGASGRLWSHRRETCAAMLDMDAAGGLPIVAIDPQTLAMPLLLPPPRDAQEGVATARWIAGRGPAPEFYRALMRGEETPCAEPGARACERRAEGALAELVDAVAQSRRLAVLALNPCDPDAMGLHVTLFDVALLPQRLVEAEHGLPPGFLEPYRRAAEARGALLLFCVGATEEVFTQCSQNLFVKRPLPRAGGDETRNPAWWRPAQGLDALVSAQFELFQVTVSASGLPGASPRNGDRGKAAFVERRGGKTYILIPYHPGNAIHGHAAKLWSNGHASLTIWDDGQTLAAATVSGRCRVVSHQTAARRFPASATQVATIRRRNGSPMPDPEYWFLQHVERIVAQREALAPCALDPTRPGCAIHAGGEARFDKKPAYFAAGSLPEYDMDLQHLRESQGRPKDCGGAAHLNWRATVHDALGARLDHLASLAW